MTTQPTISEEIIGVWDGRITMRVKLAGESMTTLRPLARIERARP